jgi:hypothetical protein
MTRFVADPRALSVTPHVAQNISGRGSAFDNRTRGIPSKGKAIFGR